MKKISQVLVILSSLVVFGCNDDERIDAQCAISVGFNLDSSAEIRSSTDFSQFDPLTYTHSTSFTFYDMSSQEQQASIYFIKTDTNQWDMYFFESDMAFDINDGISGANQQLTGQLTFDDQGVLESILPERLVSEELIFDDQDYIHTLLFDFRYLTTQSDSGFAVTVGDDGCVI